MRAVSRGALVGVIIAIIVVAAAVAIFMRGGGQQGVTTTTTPTTPVTTALTTTTPGTTTTAPAASPATPAKPGKVDTAVLIVAFETDGNNIISHAAEYDVLHKVRWFSSESIRSTALLPPKAPEDVVKFLSDVKLTGTFPYMPQTPFLEKFKEELEKRGGKVEGFVPYAYDAAMLGVLAIIKAGSTDGDAVKKALLEIGGMYCGVSGWKAFDTATGDLKYQDYYIWTYTCEGGKCEFKDEYVYVAAENKIVPAEGYKPSMEQCKITPENIKEWIAKWIKNTKLKGEIVIGILLPQSGELAVEGQNMILAAQLAIDQVNEILKELGAPFHFKYVVQDTETNPQKALQGAQVLVEQHHAKLIIGTASSAALSGIIDYVNSKKVVTISPSSTSPALAKDDYVFRVVGNDRGQGKALAVLLSKEGIKKVAVIYRKDPYGEGIALAFKENFEKLVPGAKVVLLGYQPNKPDYGPEVAQLAKTVEQLLSS